MLLRPRLSTPFLADSPILPIFPDVLSALAPTLTPALLASADSLVCPPSNLLAVSSTREAPLPMTSERVPSAIPFIAVDTSPDRVDRSLASVPNLVSIAPSLDFWPALRLS